MNTYIETDIDIYEDNYDSIINEIDELEYTDISFENYKYKIGLCFITDNNILYEINIPNNIFFKYNGEQLLNYGINYCSTFTNWQRLEIIKLDFTKSIDNDFVIYTCILKTHYIRLIQRKWRNILEQRKNLLNYSSIIKNIFNREIGKTKKIIIPQLKSMLSLISK